MAKVTTYAGKTNMCLYLSALVLISNRNILDIVKQPFRGGDQDAIKDHSQEAKPQASTITKCY